MGTYENFYLNRIKQLQEENKQLRKVLNEARIRMSPLSTRLVNPNSRGWLDYDTNDPKTVSGVMSNMNRNIRRNLDTKYILSALVDPNHDIHAPENADEKASIIRVLGDMGMLSVEREWKGGSPEDYIAAVLPYGRPAAEGGPGKGTANREDMERYIRATRSSSQGGFGYTSITDKGKT